MLRCYCKGYCLWGWWWEEELFSSCLSPAPASFHLLLNAGKGVPKPALHMEGTKFRKLALVKMTEASFCWCHAQVNLDVSQQHENWLRYSFRGRKWKPTAPPPAIAPGIRWEVHSGERSEKAGGVCSLTQQSFGALNGDTELVHWPEGPQLESHHFHCFQIKI